MAAKIRRVDFSPDEFLAGCIGLNGVERGCYITVLCLIYSRGGPVDDDPEWIAKACEVHGNSWRAVRQTLITRKKLLLLPPSEPGGCGQLMNNRAAVELGRADSRVKSARNNAEKRWKTPRKARQKSAVSRKSNGLADAGASRRSNANHQPSTIKESSVSERVGDAARAASRDRGATPRAHTDSSQDMKSLADALGELAKRGPRRGGKP